MVYQNKLFKKDIKEVLLLVCIFLYFLLRFLNIESDLPPWGIINYQPMDEGQYATMAINKLEYGTMRPDLKETGIDFLTCAHIRTNFIGNALIYLGLRLFGDNYIGLRSSSLFFGLLNFVLFILILSKLKKKFTYSEISNTIFWIVIILYSVDFSFLMSCRVVETTIYRMFFEQLVIYLFLCGNGKIYKEKIRFLLMGLFSVLSVFTVYITNIFLVFGCIITIILYGIKKGRRRFIDATTNFIAGCGIAYILSELYYYFVWDTSTLLNLMQIIEDFGGTSGYIGGSQTGLFYIFIKFVTSNCNMYNLPVLFVGLLLFPQIVRYAKETLDENTIILLSIFGSLFVQTFISEDYIVRKGILLYPILLYIVYIGLNISSTNALEKVKVSQKIVYTIYSVLCCLLCAFVPIYRIFWIADGTNYDFSFSDKTIILIQIAAIITILVMVFIKIFSKSDLNKAKIILIALLPMVMFVNLFFSIRYVYLNHNYSERNLMVSVGDNTGSCYVYGIYSISFTLYNDYKPVVNNNEKLASQLKDHENRWYIDYSDYAFDVNTLGAEGSSFSELIVYDRKFSTFGNERSVSLYSID